MVDFCDEFDAVFDDQSEVKTFLERAQERTKLAEQIPHHGAQQNTSNFMNNPNPGSPLHRGICHCLPLLNHNQCSSQTTLCCACRLIQMLPRCSCNHMQQEESNKHVDKARAKEDVKPKPIPAMKLPAKLPSIHQKQKGNAKKVLAKKYAVLEPKYYDLTRMPLPKIEARYEPLRLPERIPAIMAFPRCRVSRSAIPTRSLFRSRSEQIHYAPNFPTFDTASLYRTLSQLTTSITTKTVKRKRCCQNSCTNNVPTMNHNMPSMMNPMSPIMYSAMMDKGALKYQMWKQGDEASDPSDEAPYQKRTGSNRSEEFPELGHHVEPEPETAQEMMKMPSDNSVTDPEQLRPEVPKDIPLRTISQLSFGSGSYDPVGSRATPLDYDDGDALSPLQNQEVVGLENWNIVKRKVDEISNSRTMTPLEYLDEDVLD